MNSCKFIYLFIYLYALVEEVQELHSRVKTKRGYNSLYCSLP